MGRTFFHITRVLYHFLSIIVCFSVLFLFASTSLMAGEEEWRFVYETDDITVHKRIKTDTALIEFKSTGFLRGDMTEYLSVILDTDNMPDWAPQCLEARTIESINDRETIIYVACNGVWPVADRDYVAKRTVTSEPRKSTVRVNIDLIKHSDAPEIKSRVQITYLQCYWILKRINHTYTQVELYACVDPGGWLPTWLVNWGYSRIPYKYLKDLESKILERTHTVTDLVSVSRPLP